jgi:hypothetical protein
MNPTEFVTRIEEWQPFCAALAGASATFAGLLFVSLSVNPVLMQGKDDGADRLARHTFSCFIYLVITALMVMIPRQAPIGIGIPLFGIGLVALLQTRRAARAAGKSQSHRIARDRRLYRLSTITYATVIAVALGLAAGVPQVLYALVTLMLWQLAWATRLAWDLLMVRD